MIWARDSASSTKNRTAFTTCCCIISRVYIMPAMVINRLLATDRGQFGSRKTPREPTTKRKNFSLLELEATVYGAIIPILIPIAISLSFFFPSFVGFKERRRIHPHHWLWLIHFVCCEQSDIQWWCFVRGKDGCDFSLCVLIIVLLRVPHFSRWGSHGVPSFLPSYVVTLIIRN